MKINIVAIPVIVEFRSLGQEDSVGVVAEQIQSFTREASRYCGIEYSPETHPRLPDSVSTDEAGMFIVHMMGVHNRTMDAHLALLASLRPNLWALFTPVLFPNYSTFKGRHIGLFIRRRSAWDFIKDYLDGKTEDWRWW